MRELGKQTHLVLLCLVIILASVTIALRAPLVSADQITQRSLKLVAGDGGDGGSLPGGDVKHEFTFTVPSTASTIGSIKFEYCTIAAGTCTMPNALVTTSAALDFETGSTGWSVNNSTNGTPYLYKASAATIGTAVTLRLENITNPVDAVDPDKEMSFFVRISTYTSSDTSGTPVDTGVVTASTNRPIVLTGIMPESLIFCTGETVGTTASIPDCSTATPGDVSFNQLFSPTDTAVATSQMAASTNAGSGYAITMNGTTLTSGSNTIPAMTAAAASIPGTGQFGMNLRANTVTAAASFPYTSADIAPVSDGTNLKGQATADYNTADTFKFVSGETVANSAFDGVANTTLGPTNAQIYTASYIVNVAGNQLAGTYATTLTYICTPTF